MDINGNLSNFKIYDELSTKFQQNFMS